jgi:hypothetical protein
MVRALLGRSMRRVALLLSMVFAAGCGNVDTTPREESAAVLHDADEDGFADADDLVPCAGVVLLVANVSVDQARIELNGDAVVSTDAFPTSDMIQVFLNAAPGANSIEIETELGTGEELHVMVEPSDKSDRWLDETLTSASALTNASFGFDVTASCAGY